MSTIFAKFKSPGKCGLFLVDYSKDSKTFKRMSTPFYPCHLQFFRGWISSEGYPEIPPREAENMRRPPFRNLLAREKYRLDGLPIQVV